MGGYGFLNQKGSLKDAKILGNSNLALDIHCKYDPHFLVSHLKSISYPGPNGYQNQTTKEKLENQ